MTAMPPLVAVIGPVEPPLLAAFADHYRAAGIERFHLAFHFPDHVPGDQREELLDLAAALPGPAPLVSTGPWHEPLHAELRDRLRSAASPGWQVIADSDELHAYPLPIPHLTAAAAKAGSPVIGGVLLDRIAADGSLTGWDPRMGLDTTFNLGGFLTGLLLRGDPRKIVIADAAVPLALGSHRAPGQHPVLPRIPVHHFKWRAGVEADLRRRVLMHTTGSWTETTPAVRTEAATLLEHVDEHGGRIAVDAGVRFRPVELATIPPWWEADVADLLRRWQPPRGQAAGHA